MTEIKEDWLLTPKEEDNCFPTKSELLEYLSEPDDATAKRLTPKEKRLVTKTILYGRKIAKAQLAKALPLIRKAIFDDLDEMELIKGHHGHKKGEVMLVSCARCTYEHLKEQALKGEK